MSDDALVKEVGGPLAPGDPGTHVPEWELPPLGEKRKSRLSVLAVATAPATLSKSPKRWKLTPPKAVSTWYSGLSRRGRIILISVAVLLFLVLIIAVPVGVTQSKKHHGAGQNLPFPNNAETHTGDLTYYGVGLGACGITSKDSDHIVAVSHSLFDAMQKGSDPNQNPLCGLKIRAKRYYAEIGAERSVDVTVVDRCVGCKPTDLDVSTGVFDQLAPEASGRVDVTWAWLSPVATPA